MISYWVTLEEVYEAYKDCRRLKGCSESYNEFRKNEALNLYILWQDLIHDTYKIGKSITFCVTRPKIREVFAANFRDRIVHHLLIKRYGDLLEEAFIFDSYNCRKGKGNKLGAERLHETMVKNPEMWTVKMDMQGFFYSICKKLLYEKLEKFLREKYKKDDIEQVLKLTKMIILHCPQNFCEKRGNVNLWNSLPKDRSLFTCDDGYGLAIGNLTSQIFANFYLMDFDNAMKERYGDRYRRYVDDFTVTGTHKEVLEAIEFSRNFLLNNLGIKLHRKKITIQPNKNGVTFIGFGIKGNRIYTGSRTIYHAFKAVEEYNKIADIDEDDIINWIELFEQRMNSFLGFMCHTNSYRFREKIWNKINDKIKRYIFTNNDYSVIHVFSEYKRKTKLKKEYNYGKKNF